MAEDTIDEIWRVVEGFPAYAVSNLGRVKRILPGQGTRKEPFLKCVPSVNHYYAVLHLHIAGKPYAKYLHQLVCEAFNGKAPTPLHIIAHNDGDSTNCRADNLRWATRRENEADKVIHGKAIRGERHPRTKLTEQQVHEVRKHIKNGETINKISRMYKVERYVIDHVATGHSWAWLPYNST